LTLGKKKLKIRRDVPSTKCPRHFDETCLRERRMWIPPDDLVERQMFLDSNFAAIYPVDPSEKKYLTFDQCVTMSGEKPSEIKVPVGELAIIRNITGSLYYKIELGLTDILEARTWKKIGLQINRILHEFGESRNLNVEELLSHSMTEETLVEKFRAKRDSQRELTRKLRNTDEAIRRDLKRLIAKKASTADIAKHFHVSETIIKEKLYSTASGRRTLVVLALYLLGRSEVASKLGVFEESSLKDVLHRRRGKEYPKQKKFLPGKRKIVPPTEEEVEQVARSARTEPSDK
jgi:hypothetical protein